MSKFIEIFEQIKSACPDKADEMFFISEGSIERHLAGCHWCARNIKYNPEELSDDYKSPCCGTTKADILSGRFIDRSKIQLIIAGYYLNNGFSDNTALHLSRNLLYFAKIYCGVTLYTSLQPSFVEKEAQQTVHPEDIFQHKNVGGINGYFKEVIYKPNIQRVIELVNQVK